MMDTDTSLVRERVGEMCHHIKLLTTEVPAWAFNFRLPRTRACQTGGKALPCGYHN